MKEEGKNSKRPLSEAFGQWSNLKIAILALLGATAGEAVVWYGGQFYALFFLTQTLKVDPTTGQIMVAIALAIGTPFFIVFGWLSDKIGRKPIMLLGFLLAAITYAPIVAGQHLQGDHALRQPGPREGAGNGTGQQSSPIRRNAPCSSR